MDGPQLNAPPRFLPANIAATVGILLCGGVWYQVTLATTQGNYRPAWIVAASIVLPLLLIAVVLPRRMAMRRYDVLCCTMLALAVVLAVMLRFFPTWYFHGKAILRLLRPGWPAETFRTLGNLAIGVAAIGSVAFTLAWFGWTRSAKIVACFAAVVLAATHFSFFRHNPPPPIDVWEWHRDASVYLSQGRNPYAMDYPNVYAPLTNDSQYYPLDYQKSGRVLTGYTYPPLSLLMIFAAWLVNEDSRYLMCLCYAGAAIATACISRGRISILAATLLLLAPTALDLEHNTWTESQFLIAFAVAMLAGVRRSWTLPVWLGLMFAMKQYSIVAVPMLWLLLPRPLTWKTSLRFLGVFCFSGAIVTLPLVLWNPAAYWNSTVHYLSIVPFRLESFSLIAIYAHHLPTGTHFSPAKIGAAFLIPTIALCLWRLPRNIAGFALGTSMTLAVFFACANQSCFNYHVLLADMMLITAAVYEGVYAVGSKLEGVTL